MQGRSLLQLGACVGLCLLASYISAQVTYPEIATWYVGLSKPTWTPPNWVFPVRHSRQRLTPIKTYNAFQTSNSNGQGRLAIGLFFTQLALNAAWSPVFFGLHQIEWAIVVIVGLALAIAATIAVAWDTSRAAAWLLVPYLAWVIYAASLNSAIALLND